MCRSASNISVFSYQIRNNSIAISLLEWASQQHRRNVQARWLAGCGLEDFLFVGITERYDASLLLLNKKLGVEFRVLCQNFDPRREEMWQRLEAAVAVEGSYGTVSMHLESMEKQAAMHRAQTSHLHKRITEEGNTPSLARALQSAQEMQDQMTQHISTLKLRNSDKEERVGGGDEGGASRGGWCKSGVRQVPRTTHAAIVAKHQLTEEDLQKLREWNAQDVALYEAALCRFERELVSAGIEILPAS